MSEVRLLFQMRHRSFIHHKSLNRKDYKWTCLNAEDVQQLEDKQSIVEGLSRVIALLPAKEAAKAGQHLIAPFLQAAQAWLDADSGT